MSCPLSPDRFRISQGEIEAGALAEFCFGPDPSSVPRHYPMGDGEADSGTGKFPFHVEPLEGHKEHRRPFFIFAWASSLSKENIQALPGRFSINIRAKAWSPRAGRWLGMEMLTFQPGSPAYSSLAISRAVSSRSMSRKSKACRPTRDNFIRSSICRDIFMIPPWIHERQCLRKLVLRRLRQ